MDLTKDLQAAADKLALARRKFVRGEEGLRLLHQSREAFINSLRNTGLAYSEAKTKYDNCLDEQEAQQFHVQQQMEYAERVHQHVLQLIAQQAATV
ncbi:hypothetical protein [Achromobacter aegrifaciens]